MGRRTLTVKIETGDASNRDEGKTFVLTEMSADAAERWATRALFILANGGVELPDDIGNASLAMLATVGLRALGRVPYEAAKPLLDDMLPCIKIQPPNPAIPPMPLLVGDACQIEEVGTLVMLRGKLLELHTGFSLAG